MMRMPAIGMTLGAAVIAGILSGLISCSELPAGQGRNEAVQGRLDLRGWDFHRDGVAALGGSWGFYWDRLLDPCLQEQRTSRKSCIRVPGIWNGRVEQGRVLTGDGCATYTLEVLLPAGRAAGSGERLAVMVPDLGTAYRLFLDGTPAGAGGMVGQSTRTARPGYRPAVCEFVPAGKRVEIVLQISNFHHRKGGAWNRILLGPAPMVRDLRERRLVLDFFLLGSIVIMGMHHIILFVMRNKEVSSISFGIFCLLIAVRMLATGDCYLSRLLPGLSWEALIGAEYLSFYAAVPLFVLFLGSLFPAEFPAGIVRAATAAGVLFCGAVVLLPPRLYTHTMQTYQGLSVVMSVYVLGALLRAAARKREGAVPFLAGFIILFITVVNDVMQSNHIAGTGYLVPLGLFLFTFSQSFLLSSRSSRAHAAVERLSVELELRNRRLVEIGELKDEFLATVSHEIRTPLNGMIGLAESMIDGRQGMMGQEARYNLGLMAATGRRLARLVNDIIDSSRLRHHDIVLCRGPVDMRTVADIAIALARPLAGARPVELFNDIMPAGPPVDADGERIQQVLGSMVSHALARTDTGHVALSARVLPGQGGGAGRMEIAVTDTGGVLSVKGEAGLLDAAGGQTPRGGMGLPIARQIVELHGGTMRAGSSASGARLSITLPLWAVGERADRDDSRSLPEFPRIPGASGTASGRGRPAPAPATGASGRVLVVDDDDMGRQALCHYLAAGDYTAITAGGGRDALDAMKTESFDLVIIDIMMPGMSGYELCREIRKRFAIRELPLLVIAERYGIAGLVAGFESGANDYLVRPVHREELLARVRTLVSLKREVRDHDEARYKLLQERMNPHFLFNALNTVHALIRKDRELADRAVIMLADNYRFLIDRSFLALVPFDDEWRFVENYLELEELRFRDTLAVRMQCRGDFSRISIPPLTIQPLVENALKHGVRKRRGRGEISVIAEESGGRLVVTVSDNGAGLGSTDCFARSLGNIRKRLHHCFDGADIDIAGNATGGVTVTVTVPCGAAEEARSA